MTIKISANRTARGTQCLAAAGYTYVYGRRVNNPRMQGGLDRGAAIADAVAGRVSLPVLTPDAPLVVIDANDREEGVGPPVVEYDAKASAATIWAFEEEHWPGVTWQREQELTANLTPGVMLQGRIDAWSALPQAEVIDLKTSTAFNIGHSKGAESVVQRPDLQLLLYARLVLEVTGKIPKLWQIRHNPRTMLTFRRPYFVSEVMIEHACAQALRVALQLEHLFRQTAKEWPRSFMCGPDSSSAQYACPHTTRCMRDMGGQLADGTTPAENVHIRDENMRSTRPMDAGTLASFTAGFAKPAASTTPSVFTASSATISDPEE